MRPSAATVLWFAKYAGGGLLSYATPRFLVAAGVPLDRWIVAMGGWFSIHINKEVALWTATVAIGAGLYLGSIFLSMDHDWRPAITAAIKRVWAKVEPVHIIVLGLIIATIGVVWLYSRTSVERASNGQVIATHIQLGPENPTVFAQAAAPTASKPKPHYEPKEIGLMLGVLRDWSEAVDKNSGPGYSTISEHLQHLGNFLRNKQNPATAITGLKVGRDQIVEGWKKITKGLNDNQYYGDQLLPLIQDESAYNGELDESVRQLVEALEDLSSNYRGNRTAQIIDPAFAKANQMLAGFGQWVGKTQRNILQKTKDLREWQNSTQP